MSHHLLSALGILVCVAVPALAQTVPVSSCGDTVPAGATGIVSNDIACTSAGGAFVVAVEDRGVLDLAGHTLSGGEATVRCTRRCEVISTGGTGTIRDGSAVGIAVVGERGRLLLSGIDLVDNYWGVIAAYGPSLVRGEQVALSGSGLGIQAGKVRLTGLTATGNFTVLQVRKTVLFDSTITGNGGHGVSGRSVRLVDSTVTGNGGVDLYTDRRPRLVNSTCGTSLGLSSDVTWGVCTDD